MAGHEITIVGAKTDKNGETIFICQDSDDDKDAPIEMKESYLLPKIHHAGLPEEIASKDFSYEDSWKVGVNEFQAQRANNMQIANSSQVEQQSPILNQPNQAQPMQNTTISMPLWQEKQNAPQVATNTYTYPVSQMAYQNYSINNRQSA